MDDRNIYRLTALKLAYQKQLYFIGGLILFSLIGLGLYMYTIYQYNFQMLITAIVIIVTGIIGILTIDQKLKLISKEIKLLER